MKQDYRLLVLDLDGTLTNSKKEISPRNLRTLLRLQQSGVRWYWHQAVLPTVLFLWRNNCK